MLWYTTHIIQELLKNCTAHMNASPNTPIQRWQLLAAPMQAGAPQRSDVWHEEGGQVLLLYPACSTSDASQVRSSEGSNTLYNYHNHIQS